MKIFLKPSTFGGFRLEIRKVELETRQTVKTWMFLTKSRDFERGSHMRPPSHLVVNSVFLLDKLDIISIWNLSTSDIIPGGQLLAADIISKSVTNFVQNVQKYGSR